MDTFLRTLIDELEIEKANLLQLIEDAVKEQEFLSAHYHFVALGLIEGQLRTLRNLDDKSYDEKAFLMQGIYGLKKRLHVESNEKLKSRLLDLIAEKEKKLDELDQIPKEDRIANHDTHLKDCINQFVSGKIKGIRIILSKIDEVSIEITKSKAGTKLTMPNIKNLERTYLLTDDRLQKLKGLGFSLTNNGDRGTATLSPKTGQLTETIMKLISIIVFEVFYFKELGNGATIEILGKRNRAG